MKGEEGELVEVWLMQGIALGQGYQVSMLDELDPMIYHAPTVKINGDTLITCLPTGEVDHEDDLECEMRRMWEGCVVLAAWPQSIMDLSFPPRSDARERWALPISCSFGSNFVFPQMVLLARRLSFGAAF